MAAAAEQRERSMVSSIFYYTLLVRSCVVGEIFWEDRRIFSGTYQSTYIGLKIREPELQQEFANYQMY